ncbi:MAG: nucleotidyltransferase domain-containing protein [Myxococcota bacterium]
MSLSFTSMSLRPDEIPEHVRRAIGEYETRLRAEFASRLRKVSLFGSWARGEQHVDSDIDVLVLIDGADWRDERTAAMLSADAGEVSGVWLSPAIYSTERMDYLVRIENPFARSVAADEVIL